MLFDWQVLLIEHYIGFYLSLSSMDLKDWAAVCSIGWFLYQLIQRRRINEANIDKYLERHFTDKRKSVDDQRQTYLAHFSAVGSSWIVVRLVRISLANALRFFWFLWRLAKLEFRHASARHAMLLFDSGRSVPAQKEFSRVADDMLETAKSYRKQAALKRQEAINALIFAGRVAALEKDSEATIDAFKKAIAIRDGEYDARKFIGEQFREVNNLAAALREFRQLSDLTVTKRDQALAAEAFRLQADVLIEQGETADACEALEKSLALETERRNLAGQAATQELFGDAHKRAGAMDIAAAAYRESLENYQTVGDRQKVASVHTKLWRLQPEETFLSRIVSQFGTFLIERVAKQLRAPAPMP